jgi:hypothetical protein
MSLGSLTPAEQNSAQRHSSRNRQIVEGALLADIAAVLLLGRVYLPIPVVRTVWRLLAAAPFVLLAQRQGIRTMIMAGIVCYVLLTALVGPTLALTALDTAFAALIIALSYKWHWPRGVIAVVGGLVYTVFDIVIPTVLFIVVFRVPVSTLINGLRTGLGSLFRVGGQAASITNEGLQTLFGKGAPQLPAHGIQVFGYHVTSFVIGHWVMFALVLAFVLGIANIAGYQASSELVLERLTEAERSPQVAA